MKSQQKDPPLGPTLLLNITRCSLSVSNKTPFTQWKGLPEASSPLLFFYPFCAQSEHDKSWRVSWPKLSLIDQENEENGESEGEI